MTEGWYCKEKLDANKSLLGVKGLMFDFEGVLQEEIRFLSLLGIKGLMFDLGGMLQEDITF